MTGSDPVVGPGPGPGPGLAIGPGPGLAVGPGPAERIEVSFAGEGTGVGELSWGMWEIWHAMVAQRNSLPIGGTAALPAGSTVESVAAELRYLMGRFPSMRTRLRFGPDGHPTQQLSASGRIALELYDAPAGTDPAGLAEQVELAYRERPFDYAGEWPVRMAVVRSGGRPTHLVSVMNHLVADAAGGAIMLREVRERASGPVSGLQQLEQAAWQGSPAGQQQNARALRHWERILRTVPARRFAPSTDPREPRHWTGEFRSPALPLALPLVAARTGGDTRAALLGLYALALRRIGAAQPVVLRPVVNNRFRSAIGGTVCMAAQAGIAVLDLGDGSVPAAVAAARGATLAAYKHAYFHPERLNELIARVAAERGEDLDVQCFFNDRTTGLPAADTPPPTAPALRAALARSTFRWTRRTDLPGRILQAQFEDAPEGLLMEVLTDTRHVSPADAEALARTVEELAVEAALAFLAADAGADAGTNAGTDAEAESGAEAGADAGTGADAAAGSGAVRAGVPR
ncbi:condensation domain-containing protein [Kitasatospora cineracea]|uniref:Condensation domain-containing protein n=1 Tax=Kitasatospora cineracea TaxID=88074 RepID=A0A3N4R2L5_9ACTN|nr:condensation domain-containing protein [Kitasatospora cineracea]RPE27793.1 condensation domain-containing protein [Kitasatospora cineracea]